MATIIALDRSRRQRFEALECANDIRSRRARVKIDIKAGRRDVAELLDTPPAWLLKMKVWDLLLAIPQYGRVKVNKALRSNMISPSKTVGGLSTRQRTELAAVLRTDGHAAHAPGAAS